LLLKNIISLHHSQAIYIKGTELW